MKSVRELPPAPDVVGLLVFDHRERDAVGAVGHDRPDDHRVLALRGELRGTDAGGVFVVAQPLPELEQGVAQHDGAFPADLAVASSTGGFMHGRCEAGRAVDLAGR